MQREILFRGKRIDNGEWVYGYSVKYKPCASEDKIVYGIVPTYASELYLLEVDPKTVGQYTGLEDYQTQKIFEGDIVKLTDVVNDFSWIAAISFGNPNCKYNWGWQLEPIGKCECANEILLWIDMEETGAYCEVIGNIHDNPKLWEVKQNDD